jgi:hypothetical protein
MVNHPVPLCLNWLGEIREVVIIHSMVRIESFFLFEQEVEEATFGVSSTFCAKNMIMN